MTDTMFGNGNDQWVCPNDRQLALRAKLHTGWSVHTFKTERQRKSQILEKRELDIIMSVIQRAEQLDLIEQCRIGRLVERLDNMRRSAVGNGMTQCLLCGEVLGLLGTPSVLCQDCCKVWKRSGAWFYKALPKHVRPTKDAALDVRRPVVERTEQEVTRSEAASRTYTWAHTKVISSESDGSDTELSECSGDRRASITDSNPRRDSESSGGQVHTPVGSAGQTTRRSSSLQSESRSSLGSERSTFPLVTEDEDTDYSRPSLNVKTTGRPVAPPPPAADSPSRTLPPPSRAAVTSGSSRDGRARGRASRVRATAKIHKSSPEETRIPA
ncbi:rab effector Noc2-like [Chanos chanos]|uniref:Rab effector Noc2-like n=1 Tax=Chanos chanos TaxID=29144 RepID=A0A6J2WXA9_CHACN|nr:rab effector Noc2 [Chanos chanos]